MLLELKNTSVFYGKVQATRSVSISVPEGQIVTLIGSNGAGKSTLMKVLSGAHKHGEGRMWLDGETYILEHGIFADLAIVKAWKADETGNLVFRKTARNFNLPAATCGKVCVVEVEEIVPTGSLDPDCIHLPGVYVQRMIVGSPYDKKIEFVTTREREAA